MTHPPKPPSELPVAHKKAPQPPKQGNVPHALTSLDSTPMKSSSAGQGSVYSDSNISSSGISRLQSVLKRRMWDELYEKIGEVQDTTSLPKALFPIEEFRQSKQWIKIRRNLEKTFFPADSPSPLISSLIACQKKEERDSYLPLVKVLNAILDHIQSDTTNKSELGPLASSAFRVYDKEVRGTIDSISGRLKPDILWLLLDSAGDAQRQRGEAAQVLMRSLFWAQIFSTGEVKERNTPLLQQNATYMRALMSLGRYYTSTFVYNHKRSTFRFCFHVPFAVYLTKEFKIVGKEHFMEITEIMYAMCKMTRYQLGYHPFLELIDYKKQRLALPLSDCMLKWSSVIQLCRRVGVVGRQTLAGRLFVKDDDDNKLVSKVQNLALKDAILPQPQQDIVTFRRGFLRKEDGHVDRLKVQSSGARRSLRKPQTRYPIKEAKSEPILLDFGKRHHAKQPLKFEPMISPSFSSQNADVFVRNILGARNGDVLTTWLTGFGSVDKWDGVFRRSYPNVKHVDTEIQALDAARGMHGHAEYYVSVQLDHYYQDWFKTPLHRCSDINSPDVYDATKSGLLDLEQRTELVVYTPTVGGPLEECESPRMLVRCLLDCLIGLANWFLKGFSHRDVSTGNLLRRLVKEQRTDPKLVSNDDPWLRSDEMHFLSDYLKECHAFIIDADLAVRWKELREPGKDRSGTIPFLPTRMLFRWMNNEPVLHTTIDDLQSFPWVLLWIAFRKDPTHRESKASLLALNNDSLRNVWQAKAGLIQAIAERFAMSSFPQSVWVIRDLFNRWIALSQEATEQLFILLEDERFMGNELNSDPRLQTVFNDTLEGVTKKYLKEYMQAAVDFLEKEDDKLELWPEPSA